MLKNQNLDQKKHIGVNRKYIFEILDQKKLFLRRVKIKKISFEFTKDSKSGFEHEIEASWYTNHVEA